MLWAALNPTAQLLLAALVRAQVGAYGPQAVGRIEDLFRPEAVARGDIVDLLNELGGLLALSFRAAATQAFPLTRSSWSCIALNRF